MIAMSSAGGATQAKRSPRLMFEYTAIAIVGSARGCSSFCKAQAVCDVASGQFNCRNCAKLRFYIAKVLVANIG